MWVFESSLGNACHVGGDLHLDTSLCVDVIFCCGFHFIPCVCYSHLGISTQEPCCVKCLSIIYDWAASQQLHFENFALNWILTRMFLKEHSLQLLNSGCHHNLKGDDTALQGVQLNFTGHGCKRTNWLSEDLATGIALRIRVQPSKAKSSLFCPVLTLAPVTMYVKRKIGNVSGQMK